MDIRRLSLGVLATVAGAAGVFALLLSTGVLPGGLVIVSGTSMNPGLHAGDLAVVWDGPAGYSVGDVVAYRSRDLERVVLHRVVERSGGRYVLKGDNNSWLDSDGPSSRDVVGKLRLRLPRVGGVLSAFREPRAAAAGAGLAVLAATWGLGAPPPLGAPPTSEPSPQDGRIPLPRSTGMLRRRELART